MGRPSRVFLAIEGGGSKGRAAISWAGKIAAHSGPVGLNPNDVRPVRLLRRFELLIEPLLEACGTPIGSLHAVAAIAGAGRPALQSLCKSFLTYVLAPHCSKLRLEVTSDAEALLEACFALSDGIILVAGTGSICLGVKHTRTGPIISRVGGWGSYLDRGCGFRLGLAVLDAALRALEGRGDNTVMAGLLCERYGLNLQEVPGHFLPVCRSEVAGLAPIATDAASQGDLVARRLVRGEVAALVDMVRAVAGKLDLQEPIRLVISGGLFENRRVRTSFGRRLTRRLPGVSAERIAIPLIRILGRRNS